ncbi:UDP-N-acetylmuramoyl-tripeptide--D-alanyl-D-alanine ligase [Frigidibacter sp. SD6-1]|uniref:UDP-N-acetylmuramoyl-tripeptide--D-alanyl-D- alanine ligase n=1 Tax=Frigidibacter sp. SD6-1 TaxID=3032581 RepID=UPI0024E027AB|nr:UDP-N-acetylmuramoyl-tripeptide--D-alanyl-D-alanine ligase [Frigidibacter sp. SD6-1]
MAALWTSDDAARATGGRATRAFTADGVSIDSRTIATGDLFVALKDARDGHDFVRAALDRGAAAALVSRIPDDCSEADPLLIVPDVLQGLEALGRAGRARASAKVVAVTGSVGKTSTKEMLRTVLAANGRVHAAEASYNNHWGVPLTLARMAPDAAFAVIEVGMNHPGEIAPLARLARPHVAMITTIGTAHLEAFGAIEGIAREKASIALGLEPGGILVMPGDLPTSPILAEAARAVGAAAVTFGAGSGDDWQLGTVTLAQDTTVVQARHAGQPILFKVRTAGRHFAKNALGVLATAHALGLDPAIAACDLGLWAPPAGRGERQRISLDPVEPGFTYDLIDDAYNANPDSLAAALDVIAASRPQDGIGRHAAGRRIAILGDMLELGSDERALHEAVARHPAVESLAFIHCVGPRMRWLWEALPREKRGDWVEKADELAARAHQLADAGDVILVKGSKGSKVSLVVDALKKLGHPVAPE